MLLHDGVYLLPVLIPSSAESVGDYIKLASPRAPRSDTASVVFFFFSFFSLIFLFLRLFFFLRVSLFYFSTRLGGVGSSLPVARPADDSRRRVHRILARHPSSSRARSYLTNGNGVSVKRINFTKSEERKKKRRHKVKRGGTSLSFTSDHLRGLPCASATMLFIGELLRGGGGRGGARPRDDRVCKFIEVKEDASIILFLNFFTYNFAFFIIFFSHFL